MIKRYEWRMGYVEVGDSIATGDGWMDELSRDGWEYVSGPEWDAGRGWLCLMRREVVPGRVTSPPVEISGVHVQPDGTKTPVRLNCWTCQHSNPNATGCFAPVTAELYAWADATHPRSHYGAMLACPPTADGCPGWTAKEAT